MGGGCQDVQPPDAATAAMVVDAASAACIHRLAFEVLASSSRSGMLRELVTAAAAARAEEPEFLDLIDNVDRDDQARMAAIAQQQAQHLEAGGFLDDLIDYSREDQTKVASAQNEEPEFLDLLDNAASDESARTAAAMQAHMTRSQLAMEDTVFRFLRACVEKNIANARVVEEVGQPGRAEDPEARAEVFERSDDEVESSSDDRFSEQDDSDAESRSTTASSESGQSWKSWESEPPNDLA